MRLSQRTGTTAARPARRPHGEQGRRRLHRLYVLAAAVLAALVPLILFAGFWIRSELNKSQRDVENYLTMRAGAFSQRVDAEIQQQLVALRAVAAIPGLDASPGSFTETADRIASVIPDWAAFGLVDAASGAWMGATRPDWPGVRTLEIVRQVRDSRKPRIETPPSANPAEREVVLYVPVVRDNEVRSVLVAASRATGLQRIAVEQSRDAELLLTLADGTDRVLARSRAPETALGRETPPDYRAAVAGKERGLFEGTSREGDPISGAFVRSPLTGWVAVAAMDQRQVDQLSTRSVWATIAAGALSLVLAGILIVFIVHTVMERRVSEERLAASRALGELDARLLATTQEALGEQRKASSEREVLLREIYHRVKNNLQIVQSLLRLGSRDLSPEQREPFEGAVRRVGAMARVHTLLYNSPDLASIDFKDYLEELLKELSEGFAAEERSIVSVLDAHSMRVPLDTAVPLAFIAVELLTNSYRHAFPNGRKGRISVEIRHDEPFGTLRIDDDGIGVSSVPGAKRRLGLTIVRKLVQQIGGVLEEPPPGSSVFTVRFPLDEGEEASAKEPQPSPVT